MQKGMLKHKGFHWKHCRAKVSRASLLNSSCCHDIQWLFRTIASLERHSNHTPKATTEAHTRAPIRHMAIPLPLRRPTSPTTKHHTKQCLTTQRNKKKSLRTFERFEPTNNESQTRGSMFERLSNKGLGTPTQKHKLIQKSLVNNEIFGSVLCVFSGPRASI